jgi:hypothetical protein
MLNVGFLIMYVLVMSGALVVQSSEQAPFTSEIVGTDSCVDSSEKNLLTLCRKSWLVGFLKALQFPPMHRESWQGGLG